MKDTRPTRLMIDDMRDETHVNCELDVIARNYWTGIEQLKLRQWDVLFLDHDLSSFMQAGPKEWTGYDVMCYLEENPQHLPKKIICISSNPAGRARIEQVIEKLYKTELEHAVHLCKTCNAEHTIHPEDQCPCCGLE